MKQITQTIEHLKYGYNPDAFFPIMSGGELLNKREFVTYKVKCILLNRSLV